MSSFSTLTPPTDPGAPAPLNPSRRRRKRHLSTAALLGLTLAVGGVGGGAAGATLAAGWNTPATTVVTAQTIAQTTPANVAGAVLSSAGPSVVEITTSTQIGRRQGMLSGVGSGVVVDTDGLNLTNRHVVEGASSVTVEFSSGETRTATVLDVDSTYDLALLQVAGMPAGVAAATLGDSDDVEVGATAIAIGSPFGLEQSVTQGIVSAVDRTWLGSGTQLDGLIQTDTPINPGNSGGPLLNEAGEVIGINTMIESPVEGNVGVGFALPINVAVEAFALLGAIENVDA